MKSPTAPGSSVIVAAPRVKLPDSVVEAGLGLWGGGLDCSGPVPGQKELQAGLQWREQQNCEAEQLYCSIVDRLCQQLESGSLHWRHYNAGVSILATSVSSSPH